MSMGVRVLAVDDNDLMLDELKRLFEEDGYAFTGCLRKEEAEARMQEGDWHLIVLDQRLSGSDGPDAGLDLIDRARIHAPAARVIVITGFASRDSVQRAFAAGVDDYIEKSESAFFDILRHKARQAIEAVTDRRMLALQADARERLLAEKWQASLAETHTQRKEKLLEETMRLLFQSLPGWAHVRTNVGNALEEIDLLVRNESPDPFWGRQSDYLLVECKNWSSVVGVPEVKLLLGKMADRYGRCRLGLLVAPGGFSATVQQEILSRRRDDHLVLLIGKSELGRLIATPAEQRLDYLKAIHDRSIMATNGVH